MTPDQEKQILQSLYDRLYDAVTYSPDGKSAPWHKDTTFIQMAKNMVLNPKDFNNMLSPGNPNGDMKSAALYSSLVDAVPSPEALYSDSGKKISEVYEAIVNSANSATRIRPSQQEIYEQAFNYLNTTTTAKDFKGKETTVTNESDVALAYDQAQAAYIAAVGGYRNAYNSYNLDNLADQHAWNAVAPGLKLTVDQAWNAWGRANKAMVEEAQNAMRSSINDAVRYVISQAQELVSPQHQLAGITATDPAWLPSYAIPTNWADNSSKASRLEIKSSNLNKTASESASSYSVSASGGWGLWSASAGASGGTDDKHFHMDANNLGIDAELIFVSIKRPWFNPLLLEMRDWWMSGVDADGISNGDPNDPKGMLALVPTGFVVARNVVITADFSTQDQSFHSKTVQTHASGGWGPFSVSGSYSHSSSNSTFASTMNSGKLTLEGLQVIAWISSIMPASPPEAEPALAAHTAAARERSR